MEFRELEKSKLVGGIFFYLGDVTHVRLDSFSGVGAMLCSTERHMQCRRNYHCSVYDR